jgi:hypothetical protein
VTFWGTGGLEELRVALGGCRWLQAAAGGLGVTGCHVATRGPTVATGT